MSMHQGQQGRRMTRGRGNWASRCKRISTPFNNTDIQNKHHSWLAPNVKAGIEQSCLLLMTWLSACFRYRAGQCVVRGFRYDSLGG